MTQVLLCMLKPDSYLQNLHVEILMCIQKFPDWPPGARTANGTALCHQVQLYYYVSQSREFCHHNPLCCFSRSIYCCCCLLCYWLSL